MYKMFLDDERYPVVPDDWIIARSFDDAVSVIQQRGMPQYISFDHDLGVGKTGQDFAWWIINQHLDGNKLSKDFGYTVHSMNCVGAENINGLISGFLNVMED